MKRYRPIRPWNNPGMVEDSDGQYVLHSDAMFEIHQLRAHVMHLERKLEQAQEHEYTPEHPQRAEGL